MQAHVQGILILDLIRYTLFDHQDQVSIIMGLQETISKVAVQDVLVTPTGDGAILVFPTPGRSYEGLKRLLAHWTSFKKAIASPLVPGIRLIVHAGMMEMPKHRQDAIFDLPRLVFAAPPDTVVVSAYSDEGGQ